MIDDGRDADGVLAKGCLAVQEYDNSINNFSH
jgi:hypothetical protein